MSARILLVDDDRFLLENLRKLLQKQGYEVQTASDGEEAIRIVGQQAPDLAILDISLPDMDGLSVCRRMRKGHTFPIVMLTARSDSMDKVIGLEVGADDYLTKPFEPMELLARMRAHLRRVQEYSSDKPNERSLAVGDLLIDFDLRDALVGGKRAGLTNKEFELLAHLASNAGRVITRESLFERNWGYDISFSSNSLDVHVYRIRKKIEPDPARSQYLHTLKGYGYKLSYNP